VPIIRSTAGIWRNKPVPIFTFNQTIATPMNAYIDPPVEALLQRIKDAGRAPFWQGTAMQARATPSLMRMLFGDAPQLHRVEERVIGADTGPVPVRIYIPNQKPAGAIVYFHGGGWVIGSVDDYDAFTATLAERTGCAVISVDYRLAPEHPYPAPLHDAMAALDWVAVHAHNVLGVVPAKLIVAGDSSGANLATVAVRHYNARPTTRRYDFQVLAYPVTDADFDTESYREFAEGHLVTRADMMWFWNQYAPDTAQRNHPDLSPLRADTLIGSPPALVLVASLDPLRDDGERYAAKLEQDGVPVELVRCEGLVHGFLSMVGLAPNAAQAFDGIVDAIRVQVAV
jgi:acetyl esterase